MTFGDPNLGRPFGRPDTDTDTANNVQDVIPPTERNQDPLRSEQAHNLTTGNVQPKADDQAAPIAERVYAPASERVPKEPVPGHREVLEHTDTHTPEREAIAESEPSITRVPRAMGSADSGTSGGTTTPYGTSGAPGYGTSGAAGYGTSGYGSTGATPGPYSSPMTNPEFSSNYGADWQQRGGGRRRMFFGIGAGWMTVIATGVGVWLFMRWRAERNKPVNRIRRQARQAWETADDWRRSNIPEEATKPAAGIGSAMIPLLILLWRQSQSQSRAEAMREEARGRAEMAASRMGRHADKAASKADKAARRAAESLSEVDWQSRLSELKERWNPSRLELEKVQISKR